jgi:hypothetical protein
MKGVILDFIDLILHLLNLLNVIDPVYTHHVSYNEQQKLAWSSAVVPTSTHMHVLPMTIVCKWSPPVISKWINTWKRSHDYVTVLIPTIWIWILSVSITLQPTHPRFKPTSPYKRLIDQTNKPMSNLPVIVILFALRNRKLNTWRRITMINIIVFVRSVWRSLQRSTLYAFQSHLGSC